MRRLEADPAPVETRRLVAAVDRCSRRAAVKRIALRPMQHQHRWMVGGSWTLH